MTKQMNEIKVGTVLIAIDPCIMRSKGYAGNAALIIDKEYPIKDVDIRHNCIWIDSELFGETMHSFSTLDNNPNYWGNFFSFSPIETGGKDDASEEEQGKWSDENMIDFHNFIFNHENKYLKMGEYLKQFKSSTPTSENKAEQGERQVKSAIEKAIEDITFLRDKADDKVVKAAYQIAVTVCQVQRDLYTKNHNHE